MPPYIWMPPVHKQQKESMLCPTIFRCCHMFGCTPGMFVCPHMFGCPLYVWMPPMFGHPSVWSDAPTCLDNPYMDVLHMFGCPLYIHNTKKACFVRLRGCPYAPYIWMPPHVWMPPVCLDATNCIGASKHGSVQTYRRHPNIGCPNLQGVIQTFGHQNIQGLHPNIWGIQIYGGIQTYRGIQTYGGIQTYRGCIQIYGASKHIGGGPNIWGHPNIWVIQTYRRVFKHMGAYKHTGGHPNIWGHTNVWGHMDTPLV